MLKAWDLCFGLSGWCQVGSEGIDPYNSPYIKPIIAPLLIPSLPTQRQGVKVSPKAQSSPKALHIIVFGPKSPIIRVLRAFGLASAFLPANQGLAA